MFLRLFSFSESEIQSMEVNIVEGWILNSWGAWTEDWGMGRGWLRTNLSHKCGLQSIRSGDGRGKKLLAMTQKKLLMITEKRILLFLSRKRFQGISDEWVKTKKKNNSCFSMRHFWHWRMEQNQRERIVKQTCSLENGTEGKNEGTNKNVKDLWINMLEASGKQH